MTFSSDQHRNRDRDQRVDIAGDEERRERQVLLELGVEIDALLEENRHLDATRDADIGENADRFVIASSDARRVPSHRH